MNSQPQMHNNTVDDEEIRRFSEQADGWWDEKGAFKPLHIMTPTRITYIRDQICEHFLKDPQSPSSLTGLSIADIGCGGGLVAEPLARLGGTITGIDASEKNIAIAQTHAKGSDLSIDYQATTAEALASQGKQYDVVLALEIIEHVADVPAFLDAISALVRPSGILIVTTLNRTFKSYALAIVGAEYIMRWLPIGTHSWKKFLRPSEIVMPMQRRGFEKTDLSDMVYNPLTRTWSISQEDVSVNYMLCFSKSSNNN